MGWGGGRGGGWMKGRRRTNALAPNAVRLASSRLHNDANKKEEEKTGYKIAWKQYKTFPRKVSQNLPNELELVQILKIFLGWTSTDFPPVQYNAA